MGELAYILCSIWPILDSHILASLPTFNSVLHHSNKNMCILVVQFSYKQASVMCMHGPNGSQKHSTITTFSVLHIIMGKLPATQLLANFNCLMTYFFLAVLTTGKSQGRGSFIIVHCCFGDTHSVNAAE